MIITKDACQEDAKQNSEPVGNINRCVSTEFVQRSNPRVESRFRAMQCSEPRGLDDGR